MAKIDIIVVDTGADQSILCGDCWIITHKTERKVLVSSYLQQQPPTEYPIVSACAIIMGPNGDRWLISVNEAIWIEKAETSESLLHPFQAMRHGVMFDMTPSGYKGIDNSIGQQLMVVKGQSIPMNFDQKNYILN